MTTNIEKAAAASVAGASGAALTVRDLRISYGDVEAVKGISFDILPGEFLTLLGPSGCGKSTTLRCIAGLEPASSGTIAIDERIVAGPREHVPPEKRGINMVFQSYAVWPHMTVEKNVGYGLSGVSKDEARSRVAAVLDLVGLAPFAKRYGTELSGGQQQRVALARAIVTRPQVLLFDEPLSNLDAGLREQMRFEILELQRAVGITAVYVTHDQTEAMSMSDRVVLLKDGLIEQASQPRELYERPRTEFAANFVGRANLLPGVLDASRRRISVDNIPGIIVGAEPAPEGITGEASAVFRAENVCVGDAARETENVWPATVERVSYLGRHLDVEFRVAGFPVRGELPRSSQVAVGDAVEIGVRAADVHFVAREER